MDPSLAPSKGSLVGAIAGFGLSGLFIGVLTSASGCGSTDGSFSIHDSLARPSGYCRLTHFPGFPDTVGTLMLVGGIYLAPALVAVVGWFLATRTARHKAFSVSLVLAGGLLLGQLLVSTQAHVGYAGAG